MGIAWPVSLEEHKALRLTSIYCPQQWAAFAATSNSSVRRPPMESASSAALTVTVHYSAEGRDIPNAGSCILLPVTPAVFLPARDGISTRAVTFALSRDLWPFSSIPAIRCQKSYSYNS